MADGSFGIEVAKLAQLPHSVIARAQEVLQVLMTTEEHQSQAIVGSLGKDKRYMPAERMSDEQDRGENVDLKLRLEQVEKRARQYEKKLALFADIDFDELSPKQAFDLLWKIKEQQ